MKKRIYRMAALVFAIAILGITGCKKDDTTAPTITLSGGDVTLDLGGTYVEPGYTAEDDEDGDLTSSVTVSPSSVSTSGVAQITLTYSVEDAAGNTATAKRVVTVRSNKLAGLYDVTSTVTGKYAGTYSFKPTVAQSSIAYNKINISNFAGLGATVIVSATVSGTTITIESQSPSGMQDPGSISGSGTIQGIDIKSLNYTIKYTSGGTDTANDTFSNHQ